MEDKSKQRVEQDYARNVIHDKETGHDEAAAYEKKKLTEVAAGETHGYNSSTDKVHRRSRENRGNNYNPWDSTDEGISTLYTGEREGE
tara:strand:+ start:499 stop:762 length:264 start_codon:yes stop_codon:yes gene_type:complete